MKYLSKGTFPLLTEDTTPLWECLVEKIENDPKKLFEDITFRPGYEKVSFVDTIALNKATAFHTGFDKPKTLICAAHAHLCRDFGLAERDPWQDFIQRIRSVLKGKSMLKQSGIKLLKDPHTNMGGGLNPSEVTFLADPTLGVTFGSVPNQEVIAAKAQCWAVVKRRMFEKPVTSGLKPVYGKKPHYVLAHLLNHNLNGPGDNELNVTPFYATANSEMAKKVEGVVKQFVNAGVVVTYSIAFGPPVETRPDYQAFLAKAQKDLAKKSAERQIIEWEQKLPQHFVISASATDATGGHVNLFPPTTISNYVPLTIPQLYS